MGAHNGQGFMLVVGAGRCSMVRIVAATEQKDFKEKSRNNIAGVVLRNE